MKPLAEEEQIEEILDKIRALGLKVPDNIIFVDDINFGKATKKTIYISSYRIGEELLETIVHEIVHYNGYMHHKESFWNKYREVLNAVTSG